MSENNSLSKLEQTIMSTKATNAVDEFLRGSEVVMLLIDTSGSMAGEPIMKLREVVSTIRAQGEVAMIAFGGPYDAQVRFVDAVPEPDGGTPLHSAIPFAKTYGANRLVVISDGMPDLRDASIEEAKRFGGRIDVVYIGRGGDAGSFFLDELAKVTGGQRLEGDIRMTKELAGTVIGLLEGHVEEKRAPIVGEGFMAEETEEILEAEVEDDTDDFEDDDEDDEDEDDE